MIWRLLKAEGAVNGAASGGAAVGFIATAGVPVRAKRWAAQRAFFRCPRAVLGNLRRQAGGEQVGVSFLARPAADDDGGSFPAPPSQR